MSAKEMLKIRDNVDLKELEKFGFTEYNDCYSRDYHNDYLTRVDKETREIKKQVKTLENLVEEYKSRKVNYSTYEFDELSYRILILDIHTMLKENQKYKEVINKAINYIEDNARYYSDEDEGLVFYIEEKEETFCNNLLDILKEVD